MNRVITFGCPLCGTRSRIGRSIAIRRNRRAGGAASRLDVIAAPSQISVFEMPIRKIAQLGEPVLRKTARALSVEELSSPKIRQLIADMVETLHDAGGVGLAAPQVYESVQLVLIEVGANPRYPGVGEHPLTVLVNPRVTPLVKLVDGKTAPRDSMFVYEGCLSVAGMRGRVARPRKVRVEALDEQGNPLDFVWEGFLAVVVQHETDHLQGTLYVDRADSRSLLFNREYERYVPPELRIVDGSDASRE